MGEQREVGSRAIDLLQRERAIIWHMHVMPEDGYRPLTLVVENHPLVPDRKGDSRPVADRRRSSVAANEEREQLKARLRKMIDRREPMRAVP
jgi:hypothetical protein